MPFRFSRLDKSQPSAIMKTKGDTVTCSQAPDLIANMLYQLTIRLPSSGQHAFVERASSKIAASRRTCNAFFHICTTSLRMNCAGIGGLTTEVTVSRMGHYIILRRTLSTLSKPPRRVSYTLAGWPLFTPMRDITIYYNKSYPAMLAPGAHLSTASRSPSPFRGGIGFLQCML